MKKSQQIAIFRKMLGSKSDLLDLEAIVDSNLTFQENRVVVLRKAVIVLNHYRKQQETYKGQPIYYVNNAENQNERRSKRAQTMDLRSTAKRTFKAKTLTAEQFKTWARAKGRYDIQGVDTFKAKIINSPKLTDEEKDKILKDLI